MGFSEIASEGNSDAIKRALYDHINKEIAHFSQRYKDKLKQKIEIEQDNAIASLRSLLSAVQLAGKKLYLLIDEYDNFANQIAMASQRQGQQRYKDLLQGEGILKTVFKAVKAGSAGRGLDRVFITGLSPIVLSA